MKIVDMTTKTSLEVSPEDLLVIEDTEDTKSITVSEFMEYVNKASERHFKVYMNELFDMMIDKLKEARFVVAEVKEYLMMAWIDEPGVVNIALLDMSDSHWLTSVEIGDVLVNGTPMFTMTVGINEIQHDSYTIEEYPTDGTGTNTALADATAGYLRVLFSTVTQNETATVTYKDFTMELRDADGHPLDFYNPDVKISTFELSKESFTNSVPFESAI